jgi:hypothetical protein
MTSTSIQNSNLNGKNGRDPLSPQGLARLRHAPLAERIKYGRGVLANDQPIKPTQQVLGWLLGVPPSQLGGNGNGQPSAAAHRRKEVDRVVLDMIEATNAIRWRDAAQQHDALCLLDRRLSNFLTRNDELDDWPRLLADVLQRIARLVEAIVANNNC